MGENGNIKTLTRKRQHKLEMNGGRFLSQRSTKRFPERIGSVGRSRASVGHSGSFFFVGKGGVDCLLIVGCGRRRVVLLRSVETNIR